MLSVLARVNKDKQKNDQKTNKKLNLQDDNIITFEKTLSDLQLKEKQLTESIEKDEISYSTMAQTKFEKKLKQGASAQIVQKYESDLKSSVNKKETKISCIKEKIKTLEAQKQAIDVRIVQLENEITGVEKAIEMTQEYFNPLIERCYEEKPLDITYPVSYHKKQSELKTIKSEISSLKNNILAMKASTFDQKPQDKYEQSDQHTKKIREQARREYQEAEKERIAKEEEQNRLILEQRKAEREARDKKDEERWEIQKQKEENLRLSLEELDRNELLEK